MEERYLEEENKIKKTRRKRRSKTLLTILIVTIVYAGLVTVFLYFNSPSKKAVGNWSREIDVTNEVVKNADRWMMAEDEETQALLDDIYKQKTFTVNLDLAVTSEGAYRISLNEASYEACMQEAYGMLGEEMKAVLGKKLIEEGLNGQDGEVKDTDSVIAEVLGDSLQHYLFLNGPALMPEVSKMKEQYEKEDVLKKNEFLCDGNTLVLGKEEGTLWVRK